MALFGHGPMSDLSPLLGEERKSNFGAVRSVDDPSETSAASHVTSSLRPLDEDAAPARSDHGALVQP